MHSAVRRALIVRGVVQGVGFRPFVHALASDLGVTGFVRNETGVVHIEIEGDPARLDRFISSLRTQAPPLARIDQIGATPREPLGDDSFRIEPSRATAGAVQLPPDVATCDDCVRELFDPGDRRSGYAFVNCTNCGPRLTIIAGAPYDRARTTMAGFAMCEACRREYDDPRDRRFHAQPNACAACGPRLSFGDSSEPIADAARTLHEGRIVAIKGLGGYHLACDATNATAVATLRERKHRDEKPFAVMVADLAAARLLCRLTRAEAALLIARERPIVLAARAEGCALADGVAPGNRLLGIMLPYTPLHHLLLRAISGAPLVMTSGNCSNEPITYDDRDARDRLATIADAFLVHDRPIHTRCDDSVVRVIVDAPTPLRRSRGYAPQTIRMPIPCERVTLALGGHLKATFAFGRGDDALIGHHIGDLDDRRAYASYVEAIAHYERVFELTPEFVVHDLHPEYGSTRYANERGIERIAVQHHHAHVASCMAEHGLRDRVIGVAFDGSGLGSDGALWGGEILIADLRGFERRAHLAYVALPGGERAIREPWRMAIAHLAAAGADDLAEQLLGHVPAAARRTVRGMIEQRLNAPLTSSIGRLFDAVASLAGVRDRASFEGQAAIELEGLAATAAPDGAYAFEVRDGIIDPRPVVLAVAADRIARVPAPAIARRFHAAVAELVATVCDHVRGSTGPNEVVLTGGVFQNAIVATGATARLAALGFHVHRHREVPPNDGGLSLGQLAIAAARGAA